MLYSVATRGMFLLCTNFYDDFISASTGDFIMTMELLFMLTGWVYAQDGTKVTKFDVVCRALGVQFDFSRSESGLMTVSNAEARRQELIQQVQSALEGHTGKAGNTIP